MSGLVRLIAISGLLCVVYADLALAVPTSAPKIVQLSNSCWRISTAGVDYGKIKAQQFADELLKGDIEAFKKRKGFTSLRITSRYRNCKFHLWFFGDEFNCTSVATLCR